MRDTEWSLILFTLLAQLAVGMFVAVRTLNILYVSKSNHPAAGAIADRILLLVIVVSVLAILVSFLHIGKPRNAAYAVTHLSKSWLSREITFLLLFTVLAAISYVLRRATGSSNPFAERFAVAAGIIGLITVFAMARVYMLETVPAWNGFSTPVQFISTSLVLGGLGAALPYVLFGERAGGGGAMNDMTNDMVKSLLPVLLFLISFDFIAFLIHLYLLPGAGPAGIESFRLLTERHAVLLYLRLILVLISVVLLCILLFTGGRPFSMHLFLILCCVVVVSEIIGRYLFYASYSRVGV